MRCKALIGYRLKRFMIDPTLSTESLLFNRYSPRRVLGAGSYGKVYLADDLEQKREVAIKLINYSELPQSLRVIQDKEIVLLKSLRHPHIVSILDSYHDKTQNLICIALPLFPRGDLARLIRYNRMNPIPEQQIWWTLAQLAAALRFLHSGGNGTYNCIIHRDIKPANILVDDNFCVFLTDFGIFRYVEANTKVMTFAGTRCYMAPEQLNKNPYDYKVDMWALGVTLYELMCRKTLFKLSDDEFIKKNIKTIPSLIDAITAYSLELKTLLRRLLTEDPDRRVSAVELCNHPMLSEFVALADDGKLPLYNYYQLPSGLGSASQRLEIGSLKFLKIPTIDADELEIDALDRTPLMRAVILGSRIELNPKYLRFATSHGVTALMFAAAYGNIEAVELLMPHEARMVDTDGLAAIFYAVYANTLDTVRLLLSVEHDMRDNRACTPLVIAARQGFVEIVDLLIPQMAGLQGKSGWTALMAAAVSNNTECVRRLITKEAGLVDNHGETALMKAARCDSVNVIEILLVSEGHIVRKDGKTALMSAAELGKNNALRQLLSQAGQAKTDGMTALMFAAKKGNLEGVEILLPLEKGLQNAQGNTALIEAILAQQIITAYYLAEHEKHITDNAGVSALMHAQKLGLLDLYQVTEA